MLTKVQVQHNIQLVHFFVLLSSVPLIVQQDKKLILESMKIVITVAVSWKGLFLNFNLLNDLLKETTCDLTG